jgi:NAD(P)-dependent dehydrogenase (short-subunit alcohol dehydrogenase family)
MSRVLITGSSDGLGLMATRLLADDGHQVTLHARNDARAAETRRAVPGAEAVVVGDLASIAEMRRIAEQVNALGTYDAVIHNAGVGYREPRVETIDGLEHIFAVNVLAPYLLTALIEPPGRLVYLSSGMHTGGDASLADRANVNPATSAMRHSAFSAFRPPMTNSSTNGTSSASSGVCRPTIAPSCDKGNPVVVDKAVSGSASVPNATGTESAIIP